MHATTHVTALQRVASSAQLGSLVTPLVAPTLLGKLAELIEMYLYDKDRPKPSLEASFAHLSKHCQEEMHALSGEEVLMTILCVYLLADETELAMSFVFSLARSIALLPRNPLFESLYGSLPWLSKLQAENSSIRAKLACCLQIVNEEISARVASGLAASFEPNKDSQSDLSHPCHIRLRGGLQDLYALCYWTRKLLPPVKQDTLSLALKTWLSMNVATTDDVRLAMVALAFFENQVNTAQHIDGQSLFDYMSSEQSLKVLASFIKDVETGFLGLKVIHALYLQEPFDEQDFSWMTGLNEYGWSLVVSMLSHSAAKWHACYTVEFTVCCLELLLESPEITPFACMNFYIALLRAHKQSTLCFREIQRLITCLKALIAWTEKTSSFSAKHVQVCLNAFLMSTWQCDFAYDVFCTMAMHDTMFITALQPLEQALWEIAQKAGYVDHELFLDKLSLKFYMALGSEKRRIEGDICRLSSSEGSPRLNIPPLIDSALKVLSARIKNSDVKAQAKVVKK